MKSENILSADILDLIFENRNKQYGAYQLRKQYSKRLGRSLLCVFAAAAVLTLVIKLLPKEERVNYIMVDARLAKILPNVMADIPKPKQRAATVRTTPNASGTARGSQVVVVSENIHASTLTRNLDSVATGSVSQGEPGINPAPNGPGEGAPAPPAPPAAVDMETPRLTADIMPSYPGGMEALRKFLQRNLENPDEMEPGTVIPVKVRFVVGYDGKLKGFQTIEDGGAKFNHEVIRVLKKMPDWIPGKANGENVSVYYTVPVKFTSAE